VTFRVTVSARFEAAHHLVHYRGQPEPLHGHSYLAEVVLESAGLDQDDLAIDFVEAEGLLREVAGEFDYRFVNDHPAFRGRNTSAENLARYIADRVRAALPEGGARVAEVVVWEGPKNRAAYRPD
jgi:6-pyruvoyltetrahydropterin/6-carboxytetrahydropterin synthase